MKGLGADAPYWAALAEGRLTLPRCAQCGHWHWPAPFRCGLCGGWTMDWQAVDMAGQIYSWTRTWHGFAGAEQLGSPYITASVELPMAGFIRLFGLVENVDEPAIGLEVQGRVATSRVFDRNIPTIRWSAAS